MNSIPTRNQLPSGKDSPIQCRDAAHRELKEIVRLIAYDRDGKPVLEEFLPVDEYKEQFHPLLDQNGYRKERRIVRVSGTIFDDCGAVREEFRVRYDDAGVFVCDAARFSDGTVIGDWNRAS